MKISITCFLIVVFFGGAFIYRLAHDVEYGVKESESLTELGVTSELLNASSNIAEPESVSHSFGSDNRSVAGVAITPEQVENVNLDQVEPELSEADAIKLKKLFAQISKDIKGKNWDSLIKNASNLNLESDESASNQFLFFSFIRAITSGAPKDILIRFLNLDVDLNEVVLFAATKRGDVDIIEMLISYGLNIYGKDETGRSALFYALNDLDRTEMFDYLMVNHVETQIESIDHDLLAEVMSLCSYSKNIAYYINKLQDHNRKFSSYHKKLYLNLASDNKLCLRQLAPYFIN